MLTVNLAIKVAQSHDQWQQVVWVLHINIILAWVYCNNWSMSICMSAIRCCKHFTSSSVNRCPAAPVSEPVTSPNSSCPLDPFDLFRLETWRLGSLVWCFMLRDELFPRPPKFSEDNLFWFSPEPLIEWCGWSRSFFSTPRCVLWLNDEGGACVCLELDAPCFCFVRMNEVEEYRRWEGDPSPSDDRELRSVNWKWGKIYLHHSGQVLLACTAQLNPLQAYTVTQCVGSTIILTDPESEAPSMTWKLEN